MAKQLSEHFAVIENLHTAVKTVAVERKIEINELVKIILLRDEQIAAAYKRIGGD
jgi:hypothetical protein